MISHLQERPRISSVRYNGLKNSETQDLTEKINLPVGSQLTSYLLNNTKKIIKDHFIEKGFLNTTVDFVQKDDPDQPNNVILTINVDKKEKVKIAEILLSGMNIFTHQAASQTDERYKEEESEFFQSFKIYR